MLDSVCSIANTQYSFAKFLQIYFWDGVSLFPYLALHSGLKQPSCFNFPSSWGHKAWCCALVTAPCNPSFFLFFLRFRWTRRVFGIGDWPKSLVYNIINTHSTEQWWIFNTNCVQSYFTDFQDIHYWFKKHSLLEKVFTLHNTFNWWTFFSYVVLNGDEVMFMAHNILELYHDPHPFQDGWSLWVRWVAEIAAMWRLFWVDLAEWQPWHDTSKGGVFFGCLQKKTETWAAKRLVMSALAWREHVERSKEQLLVADKNDKKMSVSPTTTKIQILPPMQTGSSPESPACQHLDVSLVNS